MQSSTVYQSTATLRERAERVRHEASAVVGLQLRRLTLPDRHLLAPSKPDRGLRRAVNLEGLSRNA
jgi:hypothetical protein